MSRVVTARVAVLMSLVALLGGPVAGQSSPKKPTQKKPPAKTAPAKSEAAAKPAAAADIRIRTHYTSGAQISENTTYVKGGRQRVEFPGVISVEQGDLGRTLMINPASKTYLVKPYAKDAPAPASTAPDPAQAGSTAPAKPPKGGVVTYTTTLTDTGERKEMFGRQARHITTTLTKEASASACDKTAQTVEVDGWYIDFPDVVKYPTPPATAAAPPPNADACVDKVETRTKGDAKLGFPVAMKTTTRTGEGDKQDIATSSMEVTSFEMTTLDAALFDVPAGYTETRSSAGLMSGLDAGGGLAEALLGSIADGTSTAAPKGAGAVRIGVLEPVDKSTHNFPTREFREELVGNFRKAPFEALTIGGKSLAEAQADAARMQCDYVLYTEIAEIKTSKPGRVGGVLKKVSGDGPPRDVHEVRLDYKLYAVGGAGAPAFADTAKATSGGGFNVRSALHLAMFAGSLYLRFSGMGLILSPMLTSGAGGLGPLASGGMFDPRMSAMSSITQLAMSGLGGTGDNGAAAGTLGSDDSEAMIRQTVDTALGNAARGTMDQLQKNKK